MRAILRIGAIAALVALISVSGHALAADDGTAQFEHGNQALARGDYATACSDFEASYRASQLGLPLKAWADCEDARGRPTKALELYEQLERFASDAASKATILEAKIKLEARVGRIVVHGASPIVETAQLDAKHVDKDIETKVDPGEHVVTWSQPGGAAGSRRVTVGAGQRLEVPVGDSAKGTDPSHPNRGTDEILGSQGSGSSGNGDPDGPANGNGASASPQSGLDDLTIAGIVVASIGGAAGLGFAITGGVIEADGSTWRECAEQGVCGQEQFDAKDAGKGLLVPNLILGIGALVGVGAGVTLIVVGQTSSDEASAALRLQPNGVSFEGRF